MPLYTGGYLNKTPYSYLTRESADFSGLDYSASDFTVEIAIDLPKEYYLGDYGDIIRHSDANSAFSANVEGWVIGTDSYGYTPEGGHYIRVGVNGGSQMTGYRTPSIVAGGKMHLVMTFTRSTGVVKLYINGALSGSGTNALVSMPATIDGALAIGSANRRAASYTPSVSGYAMPEFGFYYARIWNDDLTATDVSDLYTRWNGTGRTDPPTLSTGTIVSAWYGADQVSDKTGSAGTGWLKDNIGGNHLKICDTGAIVGGTQPTVRSPSGSVRITSPANAATGVSGAAIIAADGTFGTGSALNYYIEIDEVNTFNGANLRNSGWLLQDGYWQPKLKPSTVYYARVKARDGEDTGTESSWSSTVSFTTRAATTWYVRPKTTVGTYGNEDGTDYDNAWNDLRWQGPRLGLQANELSVQCSYRAIAPGDTVYVCGDWGLMEQSTTTLASTSPQWRLIDVDGLSATHPVTFRLDHATYPGRVFKFVRYTGSITWTNEGNGVWSSPTYISSATHLAVNVGGEPVVDLDDPESNPLLLLDDTLTLASPGFYYGGGKIHVKNQTGTEPGNNIWYLTGSVETFNIFLQNCNYVTIKGGDWVGTSCGTIFAGSANTNVKMLDQRIKFVRGTAFPLYKGFDSYTFDNCEIGYVHNGIYGVNTGSPVRCGENVTVNDCWIHDVGLAGFENDDAHGVGWQSGSGWTVTNNLIERTGTAIEQYTVTQASQNNTITGNVIHDQTAYFTFGSGIAFTGGQSTLGIRSGNLVADNVIFNTEGTGIYCSVADAITIRGNYIKNVGNGPDDSARDGISFASVSASYAINATITDNVIIDAYEHILRLAGSGTLTGLTIDQNVYYGSGLTSSTANKFKCAGVGGGTGKTFTQWLADSTFDDASVIEDPATATPPNDLDEMFITFFAGAVVGDVNADGVADTDDLTALQNDAGAPRPALERYLELFAAEAPPTPAPGGGSAGAGRSAVWSLFMR